MFHDHSYKYQGLVCSQSICPYKSLVPFAVHPDCLLLTTVSQPSDHLAVTHLLPTSCPSTTHLPPQRSPSWYPRRTQILQQRRFCYSQIFWPCLRPDCTQASAVELTQQAPILFAVIHAFEYTLHVLHIVQCHLHKKQMTNTNAAWHRVAMPQEYTGCF